MRNYIFEVTNYEQIILIFSVRGTAVIMSTISHEKVHDNEVMVSFDVEYLFTSVLIEGAFQAALRERQRSC